MITIRLCGGAGNQLFQWAFGRSLQAHGQEVQWDRGPLDDDSRRKYLLDKLGLDLPLVSHVKTGPLIREETLRFQPGFLDLTGNATLEGYFQSECYFSDIRHAIVLDVFTDMGWSKPTMEMTRKIIAHEGHSCFVHVRRSDNLSKRGISFHGLTTSLYYERAIAIIRARAPGTHFFVFSDDPAWCKEHFREDSMTVVEINPPSFTVDADHELIRNDSGSECEDLWLMSLCQHAIIANSSFSWWGAYLNCHEKHRERIVIAPEPWFASLEADSTDIVPKRWMRMPIK